MGLDPNVLSNLVPKILARGLMVLRKRLIMPRLVNGDYSAAAAQKGSTIDVPIPVAVGTRDVAPAEVNTEISAGITPGLVQVQLNNWIQNDPIHLTDKDMAEIEFKDTFLPMQLQEAIKALAGDVNADILAEYLGIYGYVGTAATTPFDSTVGVGSATGARKVLNKQLCSKNDRRGVLDYDAEANALNLAAFSDAEKIMSAQVKLEGEIGRKYGIDWVADDDVPEHTAGTLETSGAVTVTGTAGESTIQVNGEAGNEAETLLVGDIFTFADDDQTYVVKTGTNAANNYLTATGDNGGYTVPSTPYDMTSVNIAPALKTSPSAAAFVLKATHRVNLVFHRDAFAFATRSLDEADAMARMLGGSQILSMQDPTTGLVLRLEVSRRHKLTVWEFDILWGAKLVRPELACRLAG